MTTSWLMNSETSHGDFCDYVISRSANCSRDIRKSVISLNGSETITPSRISALFLVFCFLFYSCSDCCKLMLAKINFTTAAAHIFLCYFLCTWQSYLNEEFFIRLEKGYNSIWFMKHDQQLYFNVCNVLIINHDLNQIIAFVGF